MFWLVIYFWIFFLINCFEKKENGQVYVWGQNNNGQLGLGDKENRNSPQLLESLKDRKNNFNLWGRESSIIINW